jgi:HEPN domain-containing protein
MAVTEPIDTAKDWLSTAKLALEKGMGAQAVYAMEMSAEIALKSVLIVLHVDVPKVHDISGAARIFIAGNRKVDREFLGSLDGYLATFEALLRLRAPAGYGFEGQLAREEINAQAKALLPKCSEIISACEHAVKRIGH